MSRVILAFALLLSLGVSHGKSFYAFESGPVRPVAMTPNKQHLLVANIPDNRVEIFNIDNDGDLTHRESVDVGLEPVAIAARTDNEIWVVNHLSDSVSIVDISSSPARVVNTLLVGDEPRDIVFAGTSKERAFITTAHRGQRRTDPALSSVPGLENEEADPRLGTEGIGRADVWVFDTNNVGTQLGGIPEKVMTFFGDTPRALAVSPNKETVYVAVFHSGNQTAVVHDGVVCDSSTGTDPGECENESDNLQVPNGLADGKLPGGLFSPATNASNDFTPETGLIVKYNNDDQQWQDVPYPGAAKRNWTNGIRFTLPDYDVFAVSANSLAVESATSIPHVGTVLYNMAVNPINGNVFVSNTDANNQTRYEGGNYNVGDASGSLSVRTVRGEIHKSNITVIEPSNSYRVTPRHLNKHIDYTRVPAPTNVKGSSLATPMDMVVTANGETLYVNAYGSSKIGVFSTEQLEDDTIWSNTSIRSQSQRYITVSGGGPSGMALDEDNHRMYVMTRFDNGISIIDTENSRELKHITFFNPEPETVTAGRPFLYDANLTSSNGEASCSGCHVFGDVDSLAWDLGNPTGENAESTLCIANEASVQECFDTDGMSVQCGLDLFASRALRDGINGNGKIRDFASIKGPMTTQTFRGMQNHGHMHWRGDRAAGAFGTDNPSSAIMENGRMKNNAANCFDESNPVDYDERLSFKNFVVAFEGLLGKRENPDEAQMDAFADFALELMLPPNPIRNLDNSLTTEQENGRQFFFGTLDQNIPTTVTRNSDGAPPGTPEFKDEPTGFTCAGCHVVDPENGFFGTDGDQAITGEVQVMKTPHLRNMYTKVGMFGLPNRPGFGELDDNSHQGDQIRGFGFLHDGATDTLFHFMQGAVFTNDDPNSGFDDGDDGMTQRREVESFLFAFDNDIPPIVGQQVTVSSASSNDYWQRADLLLQRAEADFTSKELGGDVKECELIAKGVINGSVIGYLYDHQANTFEASTQENPSLSYAQLRTTIEANSNNRMTFTCVPYGAGKRMALDRDMDNVKDGDDSTPVTTNPSSTTRPRSSGGSGGASSIVEWGLLLTMMIGVIVRRRMRVVK